MKLLYSFFQIKLILFGFLIIISNNGFALENQIIITEDKQLEYAESLFNEKDFETAMVEFKRFLHFFPGSRQKEHAQFKIGVCLFKLEKFHKAQKLFNEIIINGNENNITKEAYFFQSKAFMKTGNPGYAQIVLQNYLKLVKDKETKDRIYFNLAQIHLEDARNGKSTSLALARDYLLKISSPDAYKYNKNQYLDLILKAELAHRKDPLMSGIFSIIPGAGFLYCERYRDALVTFLFNTGLMYAAYTAFDNGNNALGGVLAFVETGFYTGNIYGSISSAHKYNRAQINRILNRKFSIDSKFNVKKKEYELSFNFEF